MMNWPDNKRIAVMMAFDLDAETMWTTHGDGSTAHMTNLSRGAYGPKQGVPRILDMLDSHQVKATFFIPGVVAEHYPEVVKEIARRGHDIGFHGYLHEESTKTTYEQEDATMHRSEKIIYDLTGRRLPDTGHRAALSMTTACACFWSMAIFTAATGATVTARFFIRSTVRPFRWWSFRRIPFSMIPPTTFIPMLHRSATDSNPRMRCLRSGKRNLIPWL